MYRRKWARLRVPTHPWRAHHKITSQHPHKHRWVPFRYPQQNSAHLSMETLGMSWTIRHTRSGWWSLSIIHANDPVPAKFHVLTTACLQHIITRWPSPVMGHCDRIIYASFYCTLQVVFTFGRVRKVSSPYFQEKTFDMPIVFSMSYSMHHPRAAFCFFGEWYFCFHCFLLKTAMVPDNKVQPIQLENSPMIQSFSSCEILILRCTVLRQNTQWSVVLYMNDLNAGNHWDLHITYICPLSGTSGNH